MYLRISVYRYLCIFVYVFLHISVTVYYCICVLVGGLLGPGGGHTSRPGEPHVDTVWLSLIRIYALYCLAYMPAAVVRKHARCVYQAAGIKEINVDKHQDIYKAYCLA